MVSADVTAADAPCRCPVCDAGAVRAFARKRGYRLVRCARCDFLFVPDVVVDAQRHYAADYLHNRRGHGYVDYEQDKAPTRPMYERLLHTLDAYRPGMRLLDVGTASGFFLDVARDHGYRARGIDINAAAVAEGARLGRPIDHGDLSRAPYPDASFDVITCFDFIEHLPAQNLRAYLAIIKRLLAPGGLLVCITVNARSAWARLLGASWNALLPPEHVSYFSPASIRALLASSGYEVLTIRTINKSFSLQYLFHSLYRWQGLGVWHRCTEFLRAHPRLGRASFPLPIGDNMAAVARRR